MPTFNNQIIYNNDMIEGSNCDYSKTFYYIEGNYIISKVDGNIVDTVKDKYI